MKPEISRWPPALVGSSASALRARAAFTAAAKGTASVVIVSEAGLEAARIAEALHQQGRRTLPFVTVDCAAADEGVEAQLFGRRRRAGAPADVVVLGAGSALLRARAGTLFLKHILDLPAEAQRRLARVLRDREAVSGGRRVEIAARVVAGIPPSAAVEGGDGQLRPDLLRRLSQLRVDVPALRERPGDMREIAEAVAAELTGGPAPGFTQAALTVLAAPAWPSNIDELRGVLARVLERGPHVTIRQEDVLAHLPIDGALARVPPEVSLREARRQFEREYIASVLERHRWRMSEAARTLGIERANLYRKTRQLGIVRRSPRASVAS
jgi:DNA-binding NtrC family response regulator